MTIQSAFCRYWGRYLWVYIEGGLTYISGLIYKGCHRGVINLMKVVNKGEGICGYIERIDIYQG